MATRGRTGATHQSFKTVKKRIVLAPKKRSVFEKLFCLNKSGSVLTTPDDIKSMTAPKDGSSATLVKMKKAKDPFGFGPNETGHQYFQTLYYPAARPELTPQTSSRTLHLPDAIIGGLKPFQPQALSGAGAREVSQV
jgi:hypothetical protein